MTREPFATPTNLAFPKNSRILRSADFREVYDQGFRISGPLFAAICLARPGQAGARLGLSVPKTVGNSVARNRIRRRLREAFRRHRAEFGSRYDVVLQPRRAMLEAPWPALEHELGRVIARCRN